MGWQGILAHDAIVEQFRTALVRGRLGGTFLFVGPEGVGKATLAERLAAALLCGESSPERFEPCGHCESCRMLASETHPDLIRVAKPADKSAIPLELLIGDDPRHPGLCQQIALRPYLGGHKVALIDDADALNLEGANALLKTLEEPPPASLMFLISASLDRQLPTIRSRSQIVRFAPLPEADVAELLVAKGIVADRAEAQRLAPHCGGSLKTAAELADPGLWQFREQLLVQLSQPRLASVELARLIAGFLDEQGGEAPIKRLRLRQTFGFVVELQRQVLRGLKGLPIEGDAPLRAAAESLAPHWSSGPEALAAGIERTLDAAEQVDRNVHPATLVSSWAESLGKLARQAPAATG